MTRIETQKTVAVLNLRTNEHAVCALRDLRHRVASGVRSVMNDTIVEQTRSQVRVLGAVYQTLKADTSSVGDAVVAQLVVSSTRSGLH